MFTYDKNELAVILLDSYDGLEYKHKRAIIDLYSQPSEIFQNSALAINYIAKSVDERAANTVKQSISTEYLNFVVKKLNDKCVRAVTYLSADYPKNILNYPTYPLILYAKGRTELLNAKNTFGIVGSRKTLPFVLHATEDISKTLSSSGVVIVSGSAVGGDRSALLGAVQSGNVISVLAHGSDYVYPQSNRTLVERVAESGLVISEYPPQTTSAPWRFPMRNRLISALSNAVLIVSGNEDSGTKYTAKFAEAYSKRIYAFPYSLGEKSGEICNLLIKLNKAQLVESAEDIACSEGIELLQNNQSDYLPEELEILRAIDGQTHIDQIALKTGKKVFELMPILSMLEIKGAISRESGNCYVCLVKIK